MPQLSVAWDAATSSGDWQVTPGGLATGGPLAAAVYVSLFTDRRADADDKLPAGADPRGWWGDGYSAGRWGSRLWLLRRAYRTQETLRRAKDYIAEALAWMVEDGVAARVDVATEWQGSRLAAQVDIYQRDGTAVALRFGSLWAAEVA